MEILNGLNTAWTISESLNKYPTATFFHFVNQIFKVAHLLYDIPAYICLPECLKPKFPTTIYNIHKLKCTILTCKYDFKSKSTKT